MSEVSKRAESLYRRIVAKENYVERFYIKFKLKYEGKCSAIDPLTIKSMISNAVVQLHGHAASAQTVDMLRFDKKTMEGILRVAASGFVRLWSSLTLFSQYEDKACIFQVKQVTPHLLALASNSRDFSIPVS